MKKYYILIIILFLINISGIRAKTIYLASTKPVAAILKELVGTSGTVLTVAPDSLHPLNYKLKTKEILDSYSSSIIVYVSDDLEPWVADIPVNNKIELLKLLPFKNKIPLNKKSTDSNAKCDPYFWTDPMTVKILLPILADTLGKIFTDDASVLSQNVNSFGSKIDLINRKVIRSIKQSPKKPLIFVDCEMNYFIKQYNILNAGNYKSFSNIGDSNAVSKLNIISIKQSASRSIVANSKITSRNFVKFISFETGLHVYNLDTFTDGKSIVNYADLIDYFTNIITNALK